MGTDKKHTDWLALASAIKEEDLRINLPLWVLTSEATELAGVMQRYWEPLLDRKKHLTKRPGLVSLAKNTAGHGLPIHKYLAEELLQLVGLVLEANQAFLLKANPTNNDELRARGQELVSELKSALQFLFDDGVEDERDAQLLKVSSVHDEDGDNLDKLALALDDYAALAANYGKELDGLGDFELSTIDEAKKTAQRLRERPRAGASDDSRDARAARVLRDQYATLLTERVQRVRSAARFVFRKHESIVREFTSAYERQRRAEQRRAKQANQPADDNAKPSE